ncbi:DoxX family protein [Mucilaginibacter terrenus]|uniref:DoxX family protein n=1 Tax=Mucilaginibacter terrenus TaxID=2482727 RepID=A0A3E2NW60_9SPHI|nr:DoxX family protein [Mucilaginibacter terrenus]RFZ85151.1 DoxX family protein [Mucilaginibacter terrenus]
MNNPLKYGQLYTRLALGIGFLSAVADRMGWLGPKGLHNVDWGNWDNFITYTQLLMPFLGRGAASFMGILATIAEAVFGLQLLIGYKTKLAAIGSFLLLLTFALCMAVFMGIKAPFNYSVFPASAASLLLATVVTYDWSLDNYWGTKSKF